MEAEAREREEQQLLEEQRRRQEEEEAALQKELLRLQELQQHRAAKKKKKDKAKENTAPPPPNNPQPLKQTAQNVLDNLQNGKSQLLKTLIRLPDQKEPRLDPLSQPNMQHNPKRPIEKGLSNESNFPKSTVSFHNGTPSLEISCKMKVKQALKAPPCEAALKRASEFPKSYDETAKLENGIATTADTKAKRIRPTETLAPLPSIQAHKEEKSNRSTSGKRQQQQSLTKECRASPPVSNPSPSPPPASHSEQNGKPSNAESPQPKGKAKKSKKKKGDKMNSSIGWYDWHPLISVLWHSSCTSC